MRALTWLIAAAIERLMETHVDPVVCELSNKLSEGSDD